MEKKIRNFFTKTCILLIVSLFPIIANASNNYISKDSTKQKKLHWGVFLSGNYCNWYFDKYDKCDGSMKKSIDYLDSITIPRYGFTFGINIEKYICKNFFVQTGILFNTFNIKTKEQSYVSYGGPGHIILDTVYFFDEYHSGFFSIPFNIKFCYPLNKKNTFSFFISTGVMPCFKTNSRIFHSMDFNRQNENEDKSPNVNVWLYGNGSIGVMVNRKHIKMVFAPNINFTLYGNSINYDIEGKGNFSLNSYSYGFGVNLIF